MTDQWCLDLALYMQSAISDLYISRRHTDVKVNVEDRTFHCHRALLGAVSPYFDAMFSSGMREALDGVVNIHGVTSAIFDNLLSFIYLGHKVVTTDNVEELLKAAAMLQVRFLHDKCEAFLLDKIGPESCLGAWRLAKSHQCPTLSKQAWTMIVENFPEVCRSEDFLCLDADDITSIITSDDLRVPSEELVCDSVLRWYRHDPTARRPDFLRVFGHLRLPLLGSEYLLQEIEPMDVVRQDANCRQYVNEAISYHMMPARRAEFYSPRLALRTHANVEEVMVIVGGYNSSGDKMADILAFSFLQQEWFKLTSLPHVMGREFASCVYGNDIFVSGGSQKPEAMLRYRSEYNDWYPTTSLIRGRRRHAMVAVENSIYILGGYDDGEKEECARTLESVEKYSIEGRSWGKAGSLYLPVRSMTAAVSKEKILVFGGIQADDRETDKMQCYDTRLETCCLLSDLPYKVKLSKAVVRNKVIYVVCTDGSIMQMADDDDSCHCVHVIKNFNRRRFGAVHHRGSLLVIGGETGNVVHQDLMTFDPDTKDTNILDSVTLPTRANFGGLIIVLQKKFLTHDYKNT